MIKTIFFDFGRVLMSPADDGLYEENDRIFNLPPGRTGELINEFQSRGHLGEFTEMSEYWPKRTIDAGPMNFEQALNFWQKVVSTRRSNAELINFIKKNLFKKFRLAILSNFTPDLNEYLEKYKISHFFERVFISAVLRMKKPDPAIYRHALKEMDVLPRESLFVDDKEENIATARNLGMRGVVFGDAEKSMNEIIKIII
ncbi:HAD family phosphatase [Patescibacteria group bacterium]|nr:MAG: HAD family phosphatase [Patescibacteria group bacterium]